ncbi:accessory Sec system protein Asp3 [Streptococcus uberis]
MALQLPNANLITWGQLNQNTYLYGVDLNYLSDGRLSYKQDFLPIGTVIHSWFSQTQYQANRDIPQLPLLKRGVAYRLRLNIQEVKGHLPYLRITFFNRRQEVISYQIIKEDIADFTLPSACYSYQIDLINAGCQEFIFDSIFLHEKEDDLLENLYITKFLASDQTETESKQLSVLLLENQEGQLFSYSPTLLEKLAPVLIVGVTSLSENIYLRDQLINLVKKELETLSSYETIQVIGTGKKSDRAAVIISQVINAAKALISQEISFQEPVLSQLDENTQEFSYLQKALQQGENGHVFLPTEKSEQRPSIDLVEKLFSAQARIGRLVNK